MHRLEIDYCGEFIKVHFDFERGTSGDYWTAPTGHQVEIIDIICDPEFKSDLGPGDYERIADRIIDLMTR